VATMLFEAVGKVSAIHSGDDMVAGEVFGDSAGDTLVDAVFLVKGVSVEVVEVLVE